MNSYQRWREIFASFLHKFDKAARTYFRGVFMGQDKAYSMVKKEILGT